MPADEHTVLTKQAHAKINLALAVGPVDPQGSMHPICSWIHSIDLADEIRMVRARSSSYSICWEDGRAIGWDPGDDLAVRAHRAIEGLIGRALPIDLRIVKRIPAGGGLGGGSSDAAMTIMMLDELYALELGEDEMRGVCRSLGSDVSYFLDIDSYREGNPPQPALVRGDGSAVDRVARASMPIALVVPGFGCSTPEVYRVFDSLPSDGFDQQRVEQLVGSDIELNTPLFNDLEEPACVVQPRMRGYLGALRGASLPAHVSGSGSTIFILGKHETGSLGAIVDGCGFICSGLV